MSQPTWTAFTPIGVSDECASKPRTRQRQAFFPLCATTTCMPVGSPTMQPAGATPRATMSASSRCTPMQPVSSSYDRAKWTGCLRPRRRSSGTNASPVAEKLFMSVTPRPWTLSPTGVAVNGSVSHGCPSTGTTSVWPDSTMPPVSALPSCAGSVANRLALRRSSSKVSVDATPWPASQSRTQWISARFESRLVVSNPTSVRMSSQATRSSARAGATETEVAGAFIGDSSSRRCLRARVDAVGGRAERYHGAPPGGKGRASTAVLRRLRVDGGPADRPPG